MKRSLIYNTFPSEDAKKVLKDKNLDANEKLEKVVDIYCNYFNKKIMHYAKDCTLENHYEKLFDENGKYDNKKFSEFFMLEFSNAVYVNIIELNETLNKLSAKGLKIKNLGPKSSAVVASLATVTDKMNGMKIDPKINNDIFKEFYNDIITISQKYDKSKPETL